MLVAIGELSQEKSKGTKSTLQALIHLLNYAALYSDAQVRFYRSRIIFHVHSNSSYLSLSKGHSRAGGHYFLSNHSLHPNKVKKNGAIHVLCNILKNIIDSAAEIEIVATFDSTKEALPINNTLEFLNYPQPFTLFK